MEVCHVLVRNAAQTRVVPGDHRHFGRGRPGRADHRSRGERRPENSVSLAETDSLQPLAGGLSPAQFAHPETRFKPAMRWWWQKPLDDAEALRELQVIADAGFGEI